MTSLDKDNRSDTEIVLPDGFRPRRKRPKGWEAKAIKDGVIADPDNPHVDDPNPSGVVVRPPVATLNGEG